MNAPLPFRRARKPDEITLRREALLAAAAELFDAEGPLGTGLNAIAARAGFTKSNVYRYFESREDVLLELFLNETEALVPAIEQRFAAMPAGDVAGLADAVAREFAARTRAGQLTAILAGTLEANVSEAKIIAVKREIRRLSARLAEALHARLPGSSIEDCHWAITMVAVIVAGLWPGAHPSPAAAKVLALEEFATMRPDVARDLGRAVRALFASIAAGR